MTTITRTPPVAKKSTRTGIVISVLMILFLLFDAVMKLIKPSFIVKASEQAGLSEHLIVPIGLTLLVSTLLYAAPRTAVLGAILLTGYLGGATFALVRLGQPFFFSIVCGVLVWAGLYLRDSRLRALLPTTR